MASGDTLVFMTPLAAEPALGENATFDQYSYRPILVFTASYATSAQFAAVMPGHYAGNGLTVVIVWLPLGTTAQTWVEAGDAGNALSSWSIAGATATNTDEFALYWSLAVETGNSVVRLYSDSAKTILVAEGSADNAAGGAVTLSSMGGSGLSGSVTVAAGAAADADAGNTLKADRVCWTAAVERVADGSAGTGGFAAGVSKRSAPHTTAGLIRFTEITISGASLAGIAAGDLFRLKLMRATADAADTFAEQAALLAVHVKES